MFQEKYCQCHCVENITIKCMSRFQKDYYLCHGVKKSIFNVIVSRIILLMSWCLKEFYQYHEMNDMYLLAVKIQMVVRSSVFLSLFHLLHKI